MAAAKEVEAEVVPKQLEQQAKVLDKSTLKVHLPNGTSHVVKFGDATDIKVRLQFSYTHWLGFKTDFFFWVSESQWWQMSWSFSFSRGFIFHRLLQGIIQLLTCRLGGGQRAFQQLYAMRIVNSSTNEVRWLHQDTTMFQVCSTQKLELHSSLDSITVHRFKNTMLSSLRATGSLNSESVTCPTTCQTCTRETRSPFASTTTKSELITWERTLSPWTWMWLCSCAASRSEGSSRICHRWEDNHLLAKIKLFLTPKCLLSDCSG